MGESQVKAELAELNKKYSKMMELIEEKNISDKKKETLKNLYLTHKRNFHKLYPEESNYCDENYDEMMQLHGWPQLPQQPQEDEIEYEEEEEELDPEYEEGYEEEEEYPHIAISRDPRLADFGLCENDFDDDDEDEDEEIEIDAERVTEL